MYHYNYNLWGMNLIWWVMLGILFIFISATTYYVLGKRAKRIISLSIIKDGSVKPKSTRNISGKRRKPLKRKH
jgi:hypothetical protein